MFYIQQAEEADSNSSGSYDNKSAVLTLAKEEHIVKDEEEETKKESVRTVSVEIQTDPITDGELLSLQQQKMYVH